MIRMLAVVMGAAVCMSACAPEEYGACTMPSTTSHKSACNPKKAGEKATCYADFVFDCDSLICGRFENSAAFCTHRCNPTPEECNAWRDVDTYTSFDKNSDWYKDNCKWPEGTKVKDGCPENAACVEWTPGTGAYFCLPVDRGCSSNYFEYATLSSNNNVCISGEKPDREYHGKGGSNSGASTVESKPYANGHACEVNSDCSSNNCNNNICEAAAGSSKLADGETCTQADQCQSGACEWYNGTKCGSLKAVGVACADGGECQSAFCDGSLCAEQGSDEGVACTEHSECKSGLRCLEVEEAMVCSQKRDEGGICLEIADCKDNLRCLPENEEDEVKKCLSLRSNGDYCVEHADCTSGRCYDDGGKHCFDKEDDGMACIENEDCKSDFCDTVDGEMICSTPGGGEEGGDD